VSDHVIDTLKVVKDPPSRAQVSSSAAPAKANEKSLPQSMTPISDAIIDGLKLGRDPPERSKV
jgi:hypothetical protein